MFTDPNLSNLIVADAGDLYEKVVFDSPFRVVGTLVDGRTVIEDCLENVYAPEVILYVDKNGSGVGEEEIDRKDWREATDWTAINGYSGQQGYRGPTMHSSEFLGGRMAEDVLEDIGGIYTLVTVECLPDWEARAEEENEELNNPAGWMLLKLKDSGE